MEEGLLSFKDLKRPIKTLIMNSLPKITSIGLGALVQSCTETLLDLEA